MVYFYSTEGARCVIYRRNKWFTSEEKKKDLIQRCRMWKQILLAQRTSFLFKKCLTFMQIVIQEM